MAGQTTTANTLTRGPWAADFIQPSNLLPGGGRADASQFYAQDSVLVETTAAASSSATSITVKALAGPIPAGTLLDFGGAGTKLAKTTVAAIAGATSLTVVALAANISLGDQARYLGDGTKKKVILSGTLVGRTYAERDARNGFGPYSVTDDEMFIVAYENDNLAISADIDLLKPDQAFAIYEAYLPEWDTLNTAVNEIQVSTITGSMSAGFVSFKNLANGSSAKVAYNGNLAACQAALDLIYGSDVVVASGTIDALTLTFSATNGAGLAFDKVDVDVSNATGSTSVAISRTRAGGKPILTKLRNAFRCTTQVN